MPELNARDVEEEPAIILIDEIRRALMRGTKHYNREGQLLTTSRAILECLFVEGRVDFVPAQSYARD